MPGSASVESRRRTRRPSRAESRSDEGLGWRLSVFNLACLLCCIKPASDEREVQEENEPNLESDISSQDPVTFGTGNTCDQNILKKPKKKEKKSGKDEQKLSLKQRFLRVFRRKSNRVEPLDANDTDGSDVSDVDDQDTTGEKKADKNEDEQIIEENTASAEKLAEKATSQVNDDNKLRPGDQPQGQSRSSSEIDMSLMCNKTVETAILNTIKAIDEENSDATSNGANDDLLRAAITPASCMARQTRSVNEIPATCDEEKPALRRSRSKTFTAYGGNGIDQDLQDVKPDVSSLTNHAEASICAKNSKARNDVTNKSADNDIEQETFDKQGTEGEEQFVEERPASARNTEGNATVRVHDNSKLTPGDAVKQDQSRSSSEIDMSLMCNNAVETAIRNTVKAIAEGTPSALSGQTSPGPDNDQLRAENAPSPCVTQQSQSVDGIPASSDEEEQPLSMTQSETTTSAHDDNGPDQSLRDGTVKQKTSSQTTNTDESLSIKSSKSLHDVTADRSDSSVFCVSQSHSDDCIIGKPINKRLQGLKTGLRHSQASLNLLSEQSQSVDGIPATSDEGKPALSKAQSETTTAHDDNRPDQDFRDGNVISKSSSQTNNIDNSLGIKRSRSLNDVTADITDDSALCMTQSHSEECIGKPINKRLQGLKTGLRHSQASLNLLAE